MKLVGVLAAALLLETSPVDAKDDLLVSASLQFCALGADGSMISTQTHNRAKVGDVMGFSYKEKDVVAYKYEVCAEYQGESIQLRSASKTVTANVLPLRIGSDLLQVQVPPKSSLKNQPQKPCEIDDEITCEKIVGNLLMDLQYHLDRRSDGSRTSRSLTYGDPTPSPTQEPTQAPSQAPTQAPKKYLCIYSNAAEDVGDPSLLAGHAAIMLVDTSTDPPTITTYGSWPDSHPLTPDNGAASDIRVNFAGDAWGGYPYIYCEEIDDEEVQKLTAAVGRNWEWTCTNNCASFASDVFYEVTGTDVDADELFGLETPREVGQNIRALNGGSNRPPDGLPWEGDRRGLRELQSSITSFLQSCNYLDD